MTTEWREFEYCFDSVDFGIAVREWRELRAMTQKEVAAVIGHTSGNSINRIEAGDYEQSLSIKDLIALCNWMDISPAMFFTMQGSA